MDPQLIAKLIAAGRVVIGAALVAKPELITPHWVGPEEGGRLGTRTLAAGLGARDVVIGAGVLSSLGRGTARPWLIGSALADTGDLVATLRARNELPGMAVAGTVAVAGGAAAVGFWLAAQGD
jgi:hypothetical protein